MEVTMIPALQKKRAKIRATMFYSLLCHHCGIRALKSPFSSIFRLVKGEEVDGLPETVSVSWRRSL